MSDKSILFICHESSRTGAPIFLLSFINWIKSNTNQKFYILINKGGDLDSSFQNLGPTMILHPQKNNLFFRKIIYKIFPGYYVKFKVLHWIKGKPSLIYSNTVSNGKILSILKPKFKSIVYSHIHELSSVIESLGKDNLNKVINNSDYFIAASNAVKLNLTENYKISAGKIILQYEFIEVPILPSPKNTEQTFLQLNENSDFIVGGGGFVHERKGFDLFISTAKKVCIDNNQSKIIFVWVGEFGKGKEQDANRLIMKYGLNRNVFFLGNTTKPYEYYINYNVFFLSSREDPYPLIMLENALCGNPIICFKNGGGATEFVEDDAGICVAGFAPDLAADAILFLYQHRDQLDKFGNNAREKVLKNHELNVNASKLYMKIFQNSNP